MLEEPFVVLINKKDSAHETVGYKDHEPLADTGYRSVQMTTVGQGSPLHW